MFRYMIVAFLVELSLITAFMTSVAAALRVRAYQQSMKGSSTLFAAVSRPNHIIVPKAPQQLSMTLTQEVAPVKSSSALYEAIKRPKYIAAPMVQQSEKAFRLLCRNHGCDLAFTQMLHAQQFSVENAGKFRSANIYTCITHIHIYMHTIYQNQIHTLYTYYVYILHMHTH
jgi:type IV secretory pathway VirB3-like protein